MSDTCSFRQGVALLRMVGLLTYGNKKFEAMESDMRRLVPVFHEAMHKLMPLVDLDTKAFNAILVGPLRGSLIRVGVPCFHIWELVTKRS